MELQAQLEKTRELLEDSNSRAKTDRTERELRVMQLEGEAERVRSAAGECLSVDSLSCVACLFVYCIETVCVADCFRGKTHTYAHAHIMSCK